MAWTAGPRTRIARATEWMNQSRMATERDSKCQAIPRPVSQLARGQSVQKRALVAIQHRHARLCRLAAFAAASLLAFVQASSAADLRRLPDGETTSLSGFSAYLIDPTDDYRHGALGDAIEAGGFAVEVDDKVLTLTLARGPVFEDRRVRLADLDADGTPEAIVVKSYPGRGAALAVYRILADRIQPIAESVAIGRRHRWLNPIGAADFTGTGDPMIVAVVTPHLFGSLRLYRLSGAALEVVARIDGFTNHIFGSRDLDLGRIIDVDNDGVPEIVIPTLDRQSLAVIGFKEGRARVRKQVSLRGRIIAIEALTSESATIRTDQGKLQLVSLKLSSNNNAHPR